MKFKPTGCLTRNTVNGRTYMVFRWYEGKRLRSKSLKATQVAEVKARLEKRMPYTEILDYLQAG